MCEIERFVKWLSNKSKMAYYFDLVYDLILVLLVNYKFSSKSLSSISVVTDYWWIINVAVVRLVCVDLRSIVVATQNYNWWTSQRSTECVLIWVEVSGIAGERTSCVWLLVRDLFNFFSNKVISLVAYTAVCNRIEGRVMGASVTNSIYSDEAFLAKAATSKPVLIESTDRRSIHAASLGVWVIDLTVSALTTGSIDEIVSEWAYTGLLLDRIDLILSAFYLNTWAVYQRVVLTAAAGVIGRSIGLILGASLTDVLDDDESR
jgi:hypothetical protein